MVNINKILYITHYGCTPKYFYYDKKTGKLKKNIADGGSNINIHLIKYLARTGHHVTISTYQNNYQYEAYFKSNKRIKYITFRSTEYYLGFYNLFLENIWKSIVFSIKLIALKLDVNIVISASDFLPDVISAYLLKILKPERIWVASYFLDAPTPWSKDNPYRTNIVTFLRGGLYWFIQRFSFLMIKQKADYVFVTSDPDKNKFLTKYRNPANVIVVRGGIDLKSSDKYLKNIKQNSSEKIYDACFVGRFHYQKGVVELIKIWSLVCQKNPKAKLAMIGIGNLEESIKAEIKRLHLGENIFLLGFLNGKDKFKIFRQSKIIVHPAIYDSGGMAACEAMAWGLPGVSFDLEALKSYYPKGMIKTPCFDLKIFAENILKLLEDKNIYSKTRIDAIDWSHLWGWDKRSKYIISRILSN